MVVGRNCCSHVQQQSSIDSQLFAQNRDLCLPHLRSTPPLREIPSKYCHDIWCGKTRMVWLLNSEKNLKIMIWLLVLTESTNVTDRQTDTAWRRSPRLHIRWCKNITESSTRLRRVHQRYRQTTDRRQTHCNRRSLTTDRFATT